MRVTASMLGAAGGIAFAIAAALVWWVRAHALQRGLLDMPNARSSHVQPTPRLGGIGMLAAIVCAAAGTSLAYGVLSRELGIVLGVSAVISIVSLLDDVRGLSPVGRLVVHVSAAIVAVATLGSLDAGGLGTVLGSVITVLWITGFINAFNFMDGTDGIAAAQAIAAGVAWAAIGWMLPAPALAIVAMAVVAAAAAFLVYNWPPASIFMGDVGSGLLGCLLALFPLIARTPFALIVAVLPVWPFVFDTTLTLLRRAGRGENLLAAHRSHLYQRLTQCGWPHARTAILYAGLALAGAAVAVPMATGRLRSPFPALATIGIGSLALWWLVVVQEARARREGSRSPARVGSSNHA
jgi:UDP-N-acetylmuramyl pentapeptide phosphotransferase/UDP-N-acetylglucosamine-1-phosphate transferase